MQGLTVPVGSTPCSSHTTCGGGPWGTCRSGRRARLATQTISHLPELGADLVPARAAQGRASLLGKGTAQADSAAAATLAPDLPALASLQAKTEVAGSVDLVRGALGVAIASRGHWHDGASFRTMRCRSPGCGRSPSFFLLLWSVATFRVPGSVAGVGGLRSGLGDRGWRSGAPAWLCFGRGPARTALTGRSWQQDLTGPQDLVNRAPVLACDRPRRDTVLAPRTPRL